MEEPPITSDDLTKPLDFRPRRETHRGPRQPLRRDRIQSRRSQHGQLRLRRDDDEQDEKHDEQPQGRFGSLRAALIVIIAQTLISVVLFVSNIGAPAAPPDIEIPPRKSTAGVYLTIQPPPPATPLPRSNRRRSANPNAHPTDRHGHGRLLNAAVTSPATRLGSSRPDSLTTRHGRHTRPALIMPAPYPDTPARARPNNNTKPVPSRTSHLSDADTTVVARYKFTS